MKFFSVFFLSHKKRRWFFNQKLKNELDAQLWLVVLKWYISFVHSVGFVPNSFWTQLFFAFSPQIIRKWKKKIQNYRINNCNWPFKQCEFFNECEMINFKMQKKTISAKRSERTHMSLCVCKCMNDANNIRCLALYFYAGIKKWNLLFRVILTTI